MSTFQFVFMFRVWTVLDPSPAKYKAARLKNKTNVKPFQKGVGE
jgi:hypothetical protein